MSAPIGRVLIIGGSDSGGGAGVQADIKAVLRAGAHGCTALTALTAQNTLGVQDILAVPPAFVAAQMASVLDDIGADIAKTGMLHRTEIIEIVAARLADYKTLPLVVDPVMVATSGDKLLDDGAADALKFLLVGRAFLVTPNLPEAALLTGRDVATPDDMKRAADALMDGGAQAALIKGGHGEGKVVNDVLATQAGFFVFEHERLDTANTHGTGCTLAAAIAGLLAAQLAEAGGAGGGSGGSGGNGGSGGGLDLPKATEIALDYVHQALATAPNLGRGNGPIRH